MPARRQLVLGQLPWQTSLAAFAFIRLLTRHAHHPQAAWGSPNSAEVSEAVLGAL